MNHNHIELGRRCEEIAAAGVTDSGCTVLERNFRCTVGEIDLILIDDEVLVFAEVKHIGWAGLDSLEKLIDHRKRKKILSASQFYLKKHPELRKLLIRFDVLGIDADKKKVTHFKNAFGEKALL